MNHEELESLAALYALGTLDGEDLRTFHEHLAGCEICRKRVAEHEAISAQLPSMLPPERPSSDLRSRILAEVRQGGAAKRPPVRGWPLAAAAAALAVTVLGVLLVRSKQEISSLQGEISRLHEEAVTGAVKTAKMHAQDDQKRRDEVARLEKQLQEHQAELARLAKIDALVRDLRTQVFSLAGQAPARDAKGRVFWKETEILFRPSGLPPLPEKKLYELWMLVPDKDPIPAGLYDASGTLARDFSKIPPSVDRVLGFAVTQENEGGSEKPTSALFLAPEKSR